MPPPRADERGGARERGRGEASGNRRGLDRHDPGDGRAHAADEDRRAADGRAADGRAGGDRGVGRRAAAPGDGGRVSGGKYRSSGEAGSRRRRRLKTVWERTFGSWVANTRASHLFVLFSLGALLLVAGLWTLPSYFAYRARPQWTQQFCLVKGVSNTTGCVSVEFVFPTDSVCDQTNAVAYDCENLCIYGENQRAFRLGNLGADGLVATSQESITAYQKKYVKGTEWPCWYPKGGAGFPESLTWKKANNPNAAMFDSLIWLAPFLVSLTVSVICMLRKPKRVEEMEDSEMLTGLFEEVVTGREKQKRFEWEQGEKLKSVLTKVQGETARRLDVVQEVERERKQRIENEDNLKHTLHENIRSLESRLVSEMAHRLSKIPIPDKLKKKLARAEEKNERTTKDARKDGARPDSAASIYVDHQRDERRRRGALDDDVEAQRNAFQRRLGERGRDAGEDRGERRRSKSRTRR